MQWADGNDYRHEKDEEECALHVTGTTARKRMEEDEEDDDEDEVCAHMR